MIFQGTNDSWGAHTALSCRIVQSYSVNLFVLWQNYTLHLKYLQLGQLNCIICVFENLNIGFEVYVNPTDLKWKMEVNLLNLTSQLVFSLWPIPSPIIL